MKAKPINAKASPYIFSTQLNKANERIAALEAATPYRVPVSHLSPNPWKIDRRCSPDFIKQLALSIKKVGLLHPVLVRSHPEKHNRFQIIKGEMRWRAHKELGERLITIELINASDEQMAKISLSLKTTALPLSDFELASLVAKINLEPDELERTCLACGLPSGGLEHLLAFESLPSFVLKQLEHTPRLLSAKAANQIATYLKLNEESAILAIRRNWGDLIDGLVDDAQFATLVCSSSRSNSNDQLEESNLWSGW